MTKRLQSALMRDLSCRGEAFLRCINGTDLEKDLDAMREIASKYDVDKIHLAVDFYRELVGNYK